MQAARRKGKKWIRESPLHLMMVPGIILLLIFSYGPMIGVIMAFQRYNVVKGFFGSDWVGLDNFEFILQIPDVRQVFWNTVFIAFMKIVAGLIVPVLLALLLNELRAKYVKRSIQTIIYLPYFLSWVLLAGILIDILSPSEGIVNQLLSWFGIEPIFFLGNEDVFPYMLVTTHVWKEAGFGTIIYLAALTGIDPTLYEAAIVDGANRWRQTWHVTLPGILPIVVLMTVLSLGGILNAGFDQVYNLYNPLVYSTGDIIDTMVYRMGLIENQYSLATAIGLFKSVISVVLIVVSYKLADKYAGYRVL
ncbi:sugar ABC transporter permease [Paenibacillus antri]|uniref:Sugar ABC transporter permease n=1 Tax=Paenibacillus antri TaxID=2582848 RepID=A0A5R9GI56_9BACL|nr:ABC transporter permease subunit [Paenibacillus antri]TLS52493.1 sugar ABC transporter permease [Paenibacillus antri]